MLVKINKGSRRAAAGTKRMLVGIILVSGTKRMLGGIILVFLLVGVMLPVRDDRTEIAIVASKKKMDILIAKPGDQGNHTAQPQHDAKPSLSTGESGTNKHTSPLRQQRSSRSKAAGSLDKRVSVSTFNELHKEVGNHTAQPQHDRKQSLSTGKLTKENRNSTNEAVYALHNQISTFDDRTDTFLDRFIVVPEYKLLFCYIEKSGCSMFNHLFRMLRLLHPHLQNDFAEASFQAEKTWKRNNPSHHNLTVDDLETLLQDPEWTKATFYRDPMTRFLSGYRSKCEGSDEKGPRHCKKMFGKKHIGFEKAVKSLRTRPLTNPHVLPMSYFCGGLANTLGYYDLVEELKVDTVERHIRVLFDKIGVNASTSERLITSVVHTGGTNLEGDGELVEKIYDGRITLVGQYTQKASHNTHAGSHTDDYFKNQGMIEAIYDAYKIDYETFNISSPLLDKKGSGPRKNKREKRRERKKAEREQK